jgi:hypothetical protein
LDLYKAVSGDVDWSEVARRAFEETVQRQERRRAAEGIRKLRKQSSPDLDGAAIIRKARDASASSRCPK